MIEHNYINIFINIDMTLLCLCYHGIDHGLLLLELHSQLKTNKAKCPSENPLGVTLCYETNLSGNRCLKKKII